MTRHKKNRSKSVPSLSGLNKSGLNLASPSAPAPPAAGTSLPAAAVPLEATVNLAPAAAAKLGGEALEKAAAATSAESALPGWQSLGKDHKPTHANGKQGRREKKVRW